MSGVYKEDNTSHIVFHCLKPTEPYTVRRKIQ